MTTATSASNRVDTSRDLRYCKIFDKGPGRFAPDKGYGDRLKGLPPLALGMARTCHSEGLRERKRMRNHTTEGKHDLGYRDNDGWHHICRYSSEDDARDAKDRLSDPTEKEQELIGIPADPNLEIIER